MTNRNKEYWASRSEERMADYLLETEREYKTIAKAYMNASEEIRMEAKKIFKNFVSFSGLSENEALHLLQNFSGDDDLFRQLRRIASGISDLNKKKELLNIISAPAYAYRIRRWETLQQNLNIWLENLSAAVVGSVSEILRGLAAQAYYRTVYDVQYGTGIGFSFSALPESRIRQLLQQNWSGEHYSKRIWSNTEQLAKELKSELLTGFLTGRSYAKTSERLIDKMAAGSMQCKRIVRTEANYISNQAELAAYKECGAKKYRYVSTLDLKTSAICRSLDGKVLLISEAKAGTNFPPMHPWCRSTTVMYFNAAVLKEMKRRAKDPKTGKSITVPADMTYGEWYKKYVT